MNKSTQQVMFSSGKDDWQTPLSVFKPLCEEFSLWVDAAANSENKLLGLYYGPGSAQAEDALTHPWIKAPHWLNPPYSRCKEFIAKAAAERLKGVTTVALIPARTDTKMWHSYIWDTQVHTPLYGVEVRFVKGRIKFISDELLRKGHSNSAPFPSAIIIFRGVSIVS